MAQELLGRHVRPVPLASSATDYIDLSIGATLLYVFRDAATAATLTLLQATDAAGAGSKAINVDHWYEDNGTGLAVLVRNTQTAGNVVTATAVGQAGYVEILGTSCDDGFRFVKAVASAGLCVAILGDINRQRAPESLPPVVYT